MKHDKEDNVRLFIAVLPDENVRSALTDAQDALRMHQFTGRYASDWDLHMTLTFIGEYPDADHVLMAYHNIYHAWSWLGGHADGETDLLAVALREVQEESGLEKVIPVMDEIYSVETLTVDGHEKRGEYVPSHLHLNVTYLLMADPSDPVHINSEENSGVQWYEKEAAVQASSETWFRERIYSKLNQKLSESRIQAFILSASLKLQCMHGRDSL